VSASATDEARRALGDAADWLRLDPGPPGDAVTLAELLDDDHRLVDALYRELYELQPGSPPEYRAGLVGSVAWMTLTPILSMIGEHRRCPRVDLADIRFRFSYADEIGHVWWPDSVIVDPVVDLDDTLRALVLHSIDRLGPLVDAVRSWAPVGRRGLWGRVVDVFTGLGPSYEHPDPTRRLADLAAFRRAAAGTVLDQRIEVLEVDQPDGMRRMVRTVACCYAYKAEREAAGSRPWDDGEWAGYCTSCPLIPVAESVARARYWLTRR
jgi:hypothetical protein